MRPPSSCSGVSSLLFSATRLVSPFPEVMLLMLTVFAVPQWMFPLMTGWVRLFVSNFLGSSV